MHHDPSEIGILRPIVIKGNSDIIDLLIARGTLKECVACPNLPGDLAVQPRYQHISEAMPITKITIKEGLHEFLLRSASTTAAGQRVSDIGENKADSK